MDAKRPGGTNLPGRLLVYLPKTSLTRHVALRVVIQVAPGGHAAGDV